MFGRKKQEEKTPVGTFGETPLQSKIVSCSKCSLLLYEEAAKRVHYNTPAIARTVRVDPYGFHQPTYVPASMWVAYYCPADKPPFDRVLISAEETKYYKEIPQQWIQVTEEGEETTDA